MWSKLKYAIRPGIRRLAGNCFVYGEDFRFLVLDVVVVLLVFRLSFGDIVVLFALMMRQCSKQN